MAIKTSSERVYWMIHNEVLSGVYKAGDRLREGELAKQFGVSRTPVRIALERLANDRFVDITAHAGAVVRGCSDEEIIEIFQIRALLEPFAARLAAKNRTQSQLDEMRELCAQMEKHGEREVPDFAAIAPLNNRFHQIILDAAGHHQLRSMAGSLIELNNVVRSYHEFARDDVSRSFTEHRQLTNAMADSQEDLAFAIMLSHVHAALANFTKKINRAQ